MKRKVVTENLSETQKVAMEFGKNLKPGTVIALYGDLGSGKTSFVQGVAKGLGINKRLISPTFVILRSYKKGRITFNHMDLYRLAKIEDIEEIGIGELIEDKNSILAIEWAEKMENLLPPQTIKIYISNLGGDKREIVIDEN